MKRLAAFMAVGLLLLAAIEVAITIVSLVQNDPKMAALSIASGLTAALAGRTLVWWLSERTDGLS